MRISSKNKSSDHKDIYLDHAAATPIAPEVLDAMAPFMDDVYANPSSIHSAGIAAREAIENARERIARVLVCQPSEIVFTASGTESCNLAIRGSALAANRHDTRKHLVASQIEHHAVVETCRSLERDGFEVSSVYVDEDGFIHPEDVEAAIRPETALVSVMYANNEVGTIQPIRKIGSICKRHNTIFHTDACQAAGALSLDTHSLNVDLLSLNGSKIYGPKGIGLLYVRQGVELDPIITGGDHERGLRAGTLNTPGIVGLATALELAVRNQEKENSRLEKLQFDFVDQLLQLPGVRLNGSREQRLPNNVNVSFDGVRGESLVLYLDAKRIQCATGAACTSETVEPSHVLTAMDLSDETALGSVRFSLGRSTTKRDLDEVIKVLPGILSTLRSEKK